MRTPGYLGTMFATLCAKGSGENRGRVIIAALLCIPICETGTGSPGLACNRMNGSVRAAHTATLAMSTSIIWEDVTGTGLPTSRSA